MTLLFIPDEVRMWDLIQYLAE